MHVTGGLYKGIKIETPQIGQNRAKPTLSKVRESIFNMLNSLESGNSFLDMFAGSAIMGIEAISRGFKVKELEINPKIALIIKKNYSKIKQKPDLTICNSLNYKPEINEKYDVIYIDPPWDMDYIPIIKKAVELLENNGLLIIEHENYIDFSIFNLENIKSKKYGRCLIDILRTTY